MEREQELIKRLQEQLKLAEEIARLNKEASRILYENIQTALYHFDNNKTLYAQESLKNAMIELEKLFEKNRGIV